jgi:hypothetical protein
LISLAQSGEGRGGEIAQRDSHVRFCAVSNHFSRCNWQFDYRPYPGSPAPSDLPWFNRQPEFRPALVQSFECAFAFKARELMAEAEIRANPMAQATRDKGDNQIASCSVKNDC